MTALGELPGEHDGPSTVSYTTRCRVRRHAGVVVVVGEDPDLGATPVPRLVNEGPNESRAITPAPVFLGNVESVEEHRALSIWVGQLVPVDPLRDTCIGFDDHEGRFRAAQEGLGVKVTGQAEAPAGRLGDRLVAELEASWWGRRR